MTDVRLASAFLVGINEALARCFPTARYFLEDESERLTTHLAAGGDIRRLYRDSGPAADFGMGLGDISTLADVLSVITAAWSTFVWVRTKATRERTYSLIDRLGAELRRAGVDERDIERFVAAFSTDLQETISRSLVETR